MNVYLETGALGRFLAILGVLVQAAFSFQGIELVAVAASETKNPRKNIKKAVGRVFWRILFFYIIGVFITGLIVPYNDPNLLSSSGDAAESPYVIAMQRAGIKGLPHVINAAVFTSAVSASNSYLYTGQYISPFRVNCTTLTQLISQQVEFSTVWPYEDRLLKFSLTRQKMVSLLPLCSPRVFSLGCRS